MSSRRQQMWQIFIHRLVFQSARKGWGRLDTLRLNVWDEVVPTLLRVADHHQLLADVSAAVHRDEKLPHIFLHRLDLLREEHRRLWRQRMELGRERDKGNHMWNNLQKSTLHQATEDWRWLLFSLGSFFFFFFPSPSIEVVVLQCAYSYSKITWQHSLMQPEVLFKDTPPEVFLTAWCVALNYTYKTLRANQLGVFHFDSSSHGEVSETVPPFFPPSLLSASERSWWLRERLEPVKASFIKAEKPLSRQKQRWSCFPLTQRDQ